MYEDMKKKKKKNQDSDVTMMLIHIFLLFSQAGILIPRLISLKKRLVMIQANEPPLKKMWMLGFRQGKTQDRSLSCRTDIAGNI